MLSVLCAATGCSTSSGDDAKDPEAGGHTHSADGAGVSSTVGDGTQDDAVGYALADVRIPTRAGKSGRVTFRIDRYDGSAVADYIVAQARKMHLYVVRTDLAVFRHLHPTMKPDGTWSAAVTLPRPGDYRVVAEFVARDEAGNGDSLMLGSTKTVPGAWTRELVPAGREGDDGTVSVAARGTVAVGNNGRLEVEVSDTSGRPVELGSYLGGFAHVTGFQTRTGAAVHLHSLGQPEVGEDGNRLTFHTQFEKPGDYRLFVQVRVDGFLHTVPVTVTVH
jgi:hypothetical protein